MIAEGLADEGIATVRYDKRGLGDNQSLLTKEEDGTFDQYVDDAVQVINALLADKSYSSVHIIGHSEGALIGLLAAQKNKCSILCFNCRCWKTLRCCAIRAIKWSIDTKTL